MADLEQELAKDWSLSDVRPQNSPEAKETAAQHKRVKELLPQNDAVNRTPDGKSDVTASSFAVTPRPDYDSMPTPELKVSYINKYFCLKLFII